MKQTILSVSLLAGILSTSTALAAEKMPLPRDMAFAANAGSSLRLSKGNELALVKTVKLKNQLTKAKFQQIYHGVPVYGYTSVADKSAGGYSNWQGFILNKIDKDLKTTHAQLSKNDALEKLKGSIPAADRGELYNQQATLYVLLNSNREATLVYLTSMMNAKDEPTRPSAFIDANTGEILALWDGLAHKKAGGVGGNEKGGKYYYGDDFPKMDVTDDCLMSTETVDTINMDHQTSGGDIFKFETCGDNPTNDYKTINGGYSPLNDGHYFGNIVFKMFKDWYDTTPLTFKLRMRVHFANGYDNAFWDGRQMTFGDGRNIFYPLVSLDVSAHEVAHGFTEQNSGLQYRNQSGGMNEAFSDMAGEGAKYYNNQSHDGGNDWMVGELIYKGERGKALRYFEEPKRDGRSIDHARDYRDGMIVHYSSGVFRKAFYLTANSQGWDTKKAFDAFVLANQLYWTADSSFDAGGCGVKSAARDLGMSTSDVVKAFEAVGVDATCGDEPDPEPEEVEIKLNKWVKDLEASENSKHYYYVDVPEHMNYLQIRTLDNGTGDVDLYVKYDEMPTMKRYDCRPYKDGNKEQCAFVTPKGGRYHIMLHGYKAYTGVTLLAKAYGQPSVKH